MRSPPSSPTCELTPPLGRGTAHERQRDRDADHREARADQERAREPRGEGARGGAPRPVRGVRDAVDPVGFIASSGYGSIGFLTDLGFATKLVQERIREVHTLVVETNHDERKLQDDPKRPWSVKQRILSRHGHLSNHAAATLVANIAGDYLERVILGHLSRDCNTKELALGEMERLGLDRLELFCAQQHEVSPRFSIGRTLPEITDQNDLAKIAEQVDPVAYHQADHYYAQYPLNL